jgi:hypothetical protein
MRPAASSLVAFGSSGWPRAENGEPRSAKSSNGAMICAPYLFLS